MGHVKCKEMKICTNCGGEHDYGECGSNVKVKSCNCGKGVRRPHGASFGGCQVQREVREAQRYRISHNVYGAFGKYSDPLTFPTFY